MCTIDFREQELGRCSGGNEQLTDDPTELHYTKCIARSSFLVNICYDSNFVLAAIRQASSVSVVLEVTHDYDGTEDVLVDARRVDACVGKDRGLRERSDIAQELEGTSSHICHRIKCSA